MANVDFFKQQAKCFLKDYNSRVLNKETGLYQYNPKYFEDIEDIVLDCDLEYDNFTLMNAQHVIAYLAGFRKWNELIKASEPILEIGKLLLLNRRSYQQKYGTYLVDDWEFYELKNLAEFDDESKLEIFKKVFLDQDDSHKKPGSKITIDFRDDIIAQDMLRTIMNKKNVTSEKAILSSITQKNCVTILTTGWANIAISLWGHDDPNKKFEALESPLLEIKLSKDKIRLLEIVMDKENVYLKEAILYFMIFALESLGYHI